MKSKIIILTFGHLVLLLTAMPVFSQSYSDAHFYLDWIGVVDNGEGSGGVHGPLGNLHVTVYNARGQETQSFILGGPTKGEFDDGDQAYYDNVYLGTVGPYNSAIRVKIWESDPGGSFLGRKHDVLFDYWISNYGTYYSQYAAATDAVHRARRRGGDSWARSVWNGGIRQGIPKVFVKFTSPAFD